MPRPPGPGPAERPAAGARERVTRAWAHVRVGARVCTRGWLAVICVPWPTGRGGEGDAIRPEGPLPCKPTGRRSPAEPDEIRRAVEGRSDARPTGLSTSTGLGSRLGSKLLAAAAMLLDIAEAEAAIVGSVPLTTGHSIPVRAVQLSADVSGAELQSVRQCDGRSYSCQWCCRPGPGWGRGLVEALLVVLSPAACGQ